MNRIPIIIISVNDFDDLWTRRQRFAVRLANRGHKVLYVNEFQHLLGFFSRPQDSIKRVNHGLNKQRENLYIGNLPYSLPFGRYSRTISDYNQKLLVAKLGHYMARLGIKEHILINYAPTCRFLYSVLKPVFTVWECVDDWKEFNSLNHSYNISTEIKKLFEQSDMSIVTSAKLLKDYQNISRNAPVLIRNGFDYGLFALHAKKRIRGGTVTFVGTIHDWLDFSLIERVVRKNPGFRFLFYGPVSLRARRQINSLKKYANFQSYGRIPYLKVPEVLSASEFLWIPFKRNLLLESVDLLKMYEYIAAHRIIICPDFPQAREMSDFNRIITYENCDEIEKILNSTTLAVKDTCNEIRKYDWNEQFERLYYKLEEYYSLFSSGKSSSL